MRALIRSYPTLLIVFLLLLSPCYGLWAQSTKLIQTQKQLKALDGKITNLRQALSGATDKRGLLIQELSTTEKEISEGVKKLRSTQNELSFKKQKIAGLQKEEDQLVHQLTIQQELLAHHVRARYQMGEYQPLKWLLNQNQPHKISRMLTYYQYIVQSREHLIKQIKLTHQHLSVNQHQLRQALAADELLQQQLTHHQNKLEEYKTYHQTLIHTLENEIHSNQHALQDFQKDKNNLSQLLTALLQQSAVQSAKPFLSMRKKLPKPIALKQMRFQKMNQGLTFFADEGTLVTAVHPGKVVFSDWLKGYGLLLIIDHGQGFMSLYAHNQSLFKRKGDLVRQNEQIASVGHSGGIKQNALYFEIRHQGKAISPLDWLA